MNQNILNVFDINSITGEVTVKGVIDYETNDEYEIEIQASDKGLAPLTTEKSVIIKIVDVNDNAPEIEVTSFSRSIPEDSRPGTTVALISVKDVDSGLNGKVICYVSDDVTFTLTATLKDKIEKRGDGKIPVLVIQKALDRETAGSHSLTLTALDGGKPQKAGNTRIQVKVLDINDNAPTFSKDVYSVTLTENAPIGTTVIQVNATDLDEGPNGQVVYSFGKSINKDILNIFQISPSTGLIMVKNLLDYEKTDEYEIEIQASDRGLAPLTTEKSVIIKIVDINDNAPEIKVTSFSSSIPEDSKPGTTVALTNVNDLDSGLNGEVICNFNTDVPFTLLPSLKDKMFSLVTKSPLDRERESQYDLTIIAKDSGTPQLSTEKTINVVVSDVNDNKPEFSLSPYTFYVNEGNNPGAPVFSVTASDRDENDNARISMQQNLLNLFNINELTGEITVKNSIDYEENDEFEIEIQASDKGIAPLTTEKSVFIKIVDVNDNVPEIEVTSFSSSIPEDSRPGTTVALISVNDLDSGLNGKVNCDVNSDVPFILAPSLKDKTFSLVTKSPLDRERQSQYDLTIIAKDSGTPQLSSEKTINVVVSDVNDNSPEFSLSPYTFYVPEGNNPGASVFSVRASDRDENDNARISYHVKRDGEDNNFILSFLNINSETGDIVSLKSFDFETMKTFQFQVVATDSGTPPLSNNVTVNVFILDQNDNAPVILYPLSSNGSAEGEVTDHSLFGLDRYTGQIRTLRSFTETDEAEHKLVILVKDNGNVSLSATATVIVKLVEPKEAFAASDVKSAVTHEENDNVTFYLMITLGSVSVLFLISIIVLIAMQCSKSTDYTSKYLQETNYDGTLYALNKKY
uniref:Cadherin domain-containing protein n=1 Tax=Salarias fasciatus TaxID=181472 RepID=A0A672FRH9_SALFA